MSDLNYNHLRYFWAVAHDGNLTRTAKRLNVSQSALSIQIGKLEARLGHALFERSGRRLILTEAGRIALDHADSIFSAGTELVATLKRGERRAKRVLRVGALATLSRNFQLSFLRPLFGLDDVEVILRSGSLAELLQGLETHRFDVVLANQEPARDAATSWIPHKLSAQPVSLVGTPRRIGRKAALRNLLEAHPLVLPVAESGIRAAFDALVDRLGVRPRIVAEVDDMAMLRLVAREDIGLAVVPSIVVQDELVSGLLVEASRLPGITETFYAVTTARRFPNTLLEHVLIRQPD